MKSEHRHELAENDLSKFLTRAGREVEPYVNHILIGVSLVLLVAAGFVYWSRTARSSDERGWSEFLAVETGANSSEDYADLAARYSDDEVALWATLREAQVKLQLGIQQMFDDRAAAMDQLNEAQERFETLLTEDDVPEAVREQALYGLAATLESTSDGQVEPAIEAYEQLLREFPDSGLASAAQARIRELNTDKAQEFYAWFAKQDPQPETRQQPEDTGSAATGSLNLPDVPGPLLIDPAEESGEGTVPRPNSPPAGEDASGSNPPTLPEINGESQDAADTNQAEPQ